MDVAFALGHDLLSAERLVALSKTANPWVQVLPATWAEAERFRCEVARVLGGDKRIYGINTGFGYLAEVPIAKDQLEELQLNLIRSHACGVGADTEVPVVRALLLLRAHTFLKGYSGVSRACIETILSFLRHDLLPRVPVQGSVGASGDLAPLAHLALALIGEGEVLFQGGWQPTAEVLTRLGVQAHKPLAKEGLSLINGTQFMASLGAYAVWEAKNLAKTADIVTALSLDAIRGTAKAFDARIQALRPHPGQAVVAANLRALLAGHDEILESHKDCSKVQDPYSFRCVPQVHGASRDMLSFVEKTLDTELNSVTDNPLVFGEDDIVSGGNFHGQPLALAFDSLGMAVAELGSISERRTEKITNPSLNGGLPAFVTTQGGLNSGYMIPHVVAAALASENKVYAHPASVDSIPTSADKEDHVSMGPIAATKARKINRNVAYILAIELLAACQALDILKPLQPAPALQTVHAWVRSRSAYMRQDRSLRSDIEDLAQQIISGELLSLVESSGVKIS